MAVEFGAHAPRMRRQQRHAVAHHQRLFDRVRDEQQREAHLVPQFEQLLLHAAARERVERGKGLVHQQHARLHRQRPRDRHALLHAARELVRVHIGELREAHLVQVVQRALGRFLAPQRARGEQREHHVLLHRLPRRQLVELLEHDDAVGARLRHAPAVEPDLALDRRDEPGHRLEQRGLAAARGPEQHEAVGGMHVEAHAVRGAHHALGRAVLEADALDLQQRLVHVRRCRVARGHHAAPPCRPLRRHAAAEEGRGGRPRQALEPGQHRVSSPRPCARRRRNSPSPTPACS
ncbi:hypothetical protein D9M72_372650 [compost metagenome]